MTSVSLNIDNLCINTIRTLCMDAIQKANSGHPGTPMGLAPVAYVLWTKFLKHHPKNPSWLDRDRFILSSGHASMLLYSLLYLSGYGLTIEDIQNFRQWKSMTPGHPEFGHTIGVETTTGPLGQGIANGVGMAMAERHLSIKFNRPNNEIIDHYTYIICGDGDQMEGVASEAVSLAGHLKLSRLILIYDDNKISIEGKTDISFTEDVGGRFKAYNWHVQKVYDGNNINNIEKAIKNAKKETDRPSIIILRTNIAYGSPNKQDTADAHGAPLGEEEIKLTKKNLGWPEDAYFFVPEEVKEKFKEILNKGDAAEKKWNELFKAYNKTYPELGNELVNAISGFLPFDWDAEIPEFKVSDNPIATRVASGKVLNAIANKVTTLIGGSADLAPSNKTYLDCSHEFQSGNYEGRNIRFGVREHGMAAIMSGMFLHNGLRPYGGTFLVFADYLRGAMRVASLMKLPLIYVFTHDSVAVGEDGPTHQPVEHIASLRIIPGLTVIRPADGNETAAAWRRAILTNDSPVALILSRQKLPILDRKKAVSGLDQGAYIISDSDGKPDIILIATGSEVYISIQAQKILVEKGINVRVISMPSWELYEKMDDTYKKSILPPEITARVSIEAGICMGWEKYVGGKGISISIDEFGASAPGSKVLESFGFTVENIVKSAMHLLEK